MIRLFWALNFFFLSVAIDPRMCVAGPLDAFKEFTSAVTRKYSHRVDRSDPVLRTVKV